MSDTNHAGKPIEHVWIGSIDDHPDMKTATVKAQYNPGTLEISQNVPWKKPEAASKGGQQAKGPPKDDNFNALEFTGAEGRSMTLELLFDAFEGGTDAVDVLASVQALENLAAVRDPTNTEEKMRRPHHCVVVWGETLKNSKGENFKCVIENLTTKYTMFDPNGKPLRATCTVKLKEAAQVDRKKT
jgi:hypothetical protein